jgi:hypothetical protein
MEVLGFTITRNAAGQYDSKSNDDGSGQPPIPPSVLKLLDRTRNLYRTWWMMHYATGLAGVVAGALLTALTAAPAMAVANSGMSHSLGELRDYAWLIGIVAAVATSLVTFLGPLHKAERYWSAYHLLEQACLEYRGDEGNPKLGKLMKRVMQVRRILQVADVDEKIVGVAAASPGPSA